MAAFRKLEARPNEAIVSSMGGNVEEMIRGGSQNGNLRECAAVRPFANAAKDRPPAIEGLERANSTRCTT